MRFKLMKKVLVIGYVWFEFNLFVVGIYMMLFLCVFCVENW